MHEIAQKIQTDLQNLGVEKGDSLLVHTSFRALGKGVTGEDVVTGVMAALGTRGTLLVPAFSYTNVTKEKNAFDVRVTPSCVGYFPEFFRGYPGVVRSLHPTHSVSALGDAAEEYIKDHRLDKTPVGPHSPLRALFKKKGKILFLGCSTRSNTSMHGVEELIVPDYLFGEQVEYSLTNYDGKTYNAVYRTHGFSRTAQRYERAAALLSPGEIARGNVLAAECTLMSAAALWQKGKEALEQDSHYFVEIF